MPISDELVPLEDVMAELFVPWSDDRKAEAKAAHQVHYNRLLKEWPLEDEDGLAKELGRLDALFGV